MRSSLAIRLLLPAAALGGLLAGGDPAGLPADAQVQRDRSHYALIETQERRSLGVWCPPPDSVLASDQGRLRAVNYSRYYRGESDLLANTLVMIFEQYRLINAIVNVTAVAWEPGGEKLLLHETILDDSAKWFVLDVGAGEYDKTGPDRLRTSLGPRSYEFVSWTDPDEIVFEDYFTGKEVRVRVR